MKLNESLEYNGFVIKRHDTFSFAVYYRGEQPPTQRLEAYFGSFDDLDDAKLTVDVVINALWMLCKDPD
jgi:hypothetical protein